MLYNIVLTRTMLISKYVVVDNGKENVEDFVNVLLRDLILMLSRKERKNSKEMQKMKCAWRFTSSDS